MPLQGTSILKQRDDRLIERRVIGGVDKIFSSSSSSWLGIRGWKAVRSVQGRHVRFGVRQSERLHRVLLFRENNFLPASRP